MLFRSHKRDAVAVAAVHVGLDLEDKARELVARGLHGLAAQRVGVGERRRGEAQEVLEEGLHAKVGEGRAKEHRGQAPMANGVEVILVVRAIEQLDVMYFPMLS